MRAEQTSSKDLATLTSRAALNAILDRAFDFGEAEVELHSLGEVDAVADALLSRAEAITGSPHSIALWGLDDLPKHYKLRVAWIVPRARTTYHRGSNLRGSRW